MEFGIERLTFIVDFAVAVLISIDYCFVDNLLELGVLQIAAHHHFEYGKQLAVRYVAVTVHVVHFEGNFTIDINCN